MELDRMSGTELATSAVSEMVCKRGTQVCHEHSFAEKLDKVNMEAALVRVELQHSSRLSVVSLTVIFCCTFKTNKPPIIPSIFFLQNCNWSKSCFHCSRMTLRYRTSLWKWIVSELLLIWLTNKANWEQQFTYFSTRMAQVSVLLFQHWTGAHVDQTSGD